MTEAISHQKKGGERSAVLLGIGLLVGTALGWGLGGTGIFPRSGETIPGKYPGGADAVTFQGSATAEGASGDVLDDLIDSGAGEGYQRNRKVIAFVDGLKAGDIEGRVDAVFARRRGNQGYDLITSLYQKWVEEDPAAALHHAEGLEGKDRKTALNAVLSAWAEKEPYETLAWIEEHGNASELSSAAYSALRAIAQKDPENAIALASMKWLSGISPSSLYGIWATKDPMAASAHALAIPNSQERHNALQSLSKQWAYENQQAVWEWANGLENSRDRDVVLQNVVNNVAGDGDTSQAIAFLEEMPPGDARIGALRTITSIMASTDPENAYEFARSQVKSGKDEQVFTSLFYQWARSDPARAFEVAFDELDPGVARNSAIQNIMSQVVTRDIALAREMLQKLDPEAMHNSVYSVAREFAQIDVNSAIAWAEELPAGDAKKYAYSTILSEWAQEDPIKASAYGLQIKDEDYRRRGLQSALRQWSSKDSVAAMTWAVKNLDAMDQLSLIPGSLIGNWVGQDASSAAAWVATLPEGDLRTRSVSSLVSSWSGHDLISAGEWIKKLKPGDGRDSAARQYSSQVYETDPESALIWAESIRKEDARNSQVMNLARRYLQADPAKAKRWIEGSSLPPGKQAELLKESGKK